MEHTLPRLIVASNNKNKLKEFDAILGHLYNIVSMRDAGIDADIEEDGTTFEDNALIKAKYVMDVTGSAAIADDSGLEVDALGGAPGVYSARYCGRHGDDEANNDKLLRLLDESGVPDEQRTAHYVAAVAAVFPDGREFVTRGECYGRIAHERHGSGGFGYDPLFLVSTAGTESNEQAAQGEFNQTFGEVPPAVKDSQSHRSRGLQNMYDILKREL